MSVSTLLDAARKHRVLLRELAQNMLARGSAVTPTFRAMESANNAPPSGVAPIEDTDLWRILLDELKDAGLLDADKLLDALYEIYPGYRA